MNCLEQPHTTGNGGISPQIRTDCTLYLYFSGLRAICTNNATYNSARKPNTNLFNVRTAEHACYDLFTKQIFVVIKDEVARSAMVLQIEEIYENRKYFLIRKLIKQFN